MASYVRKLPVAPEALFNPSMSCLRTATMCFCWFFEALLIDFSALTSFFQALFCDMLKDWRIVGNLMLERRVSELLPSSSPISSSSSAPETVAKSSAMLFVDRHRLLPRRLGASARFSASSYRLYSLTSSATCPKSLAPEFRSQMTRQGVWRTPM